MATKQIIVRGLRILGILFFALGGYLTYEYRMFLNETTPFKVSVTKVTPQKKTTDLYFSFTTPDNRRITVKETSRSLSSYPEVGDELLYYFNQNNPEKSRLSSGWHTWQGSIIAGFGLLLFISTTLPLIYQKRKAKLDRINKTR